jgi:phosphonopyruvate decarboxylase
VIQAIDFIRPSLKRGFDFWTGVPCSFLTPFINFVSQSPDLTYISATNEGEAVGLAMGAYLSGRKSVVISQNSGLGNMVNPLCSLNYPFKIPMLLIVTHRGAPHLKDEPQHELMGVITEELLSVLRIPFSKFPDDPADIPRALDEACDYMDEHSLPYAFVMKKGTVEPNPLERKAEETPPLTSKPQGEFSASVNEHMTRLDAVRIIKGRLDEDKLIVATTGKIGRELFSCGHSANQIYIVGGMGCASAIGLGISLCLKNRTVVVLDGDGAALMKMGNLATIGHYHPKNLIHIILDNEAHESTGAQPTVSRSTDLAQVATACSYNRVFRSDTSTTLKAALNEALNAEGPAMIHVKVSIGSDDSLGRPTVSPVQVKTQFMGHIANG